MYILELKVKPLRAYFILTVTNLDSHLPVLKADLFQKNEVNSKWQIFCSSINAISSEKC